MEAKCIGGPKAGETENFKFGNEFLVRKASPLSHPFLAADHREEAYKTEKYRIEKFWNNSPTGETEDYIWVHESIPTHEIMSHLIAHYSPETGRKALTEVE